MPFNTSRLKWMDKYGWHEFANSRNIFLCVYLTSSSKVWRPTIVPSKIVKLLLLRTRCHILSILRLNTLATFHVLIRGLLSFLRPIKSYLLDPLTASFWMNVFSFSSNSGGCPAWNGEANLQAIGAAWKAVECSQSTPEPFNCGAVGAHACCSSCRWRRVNWWLRQRR